MPMLPSIFSLTPPILGFGAQRAATGQRGLQNVTDRISQALQFFSQLNEQTQARGRQQELQRKQIQEQESARKTAEKRQNRSQNIGFGITAASALVGGLSAATAPANMAIQTGIKSTGDAASKEALKQGTQQAVKQGTSQAIKQGASQSVGSSLPEVVGPPVNIGAPAGLSTGNNLDIVNAPGQGLFMGPTQANIPQSVAPPLDVSSTPVAANAPASIGSQIIDGPGTSTIQLPEGAGANTGITINGRPQTFGSTLGLREQDMLPFGQKSAAARFGLGFLTSLADNLTGSNLFATGFNLPQRNIQNALALKNIGLNEADIALRRDRVGLERTNADIRQREFDARRTQNRFNALRGLESAGAISTQEFRSGLGIPGNVPPVLPTVKTTLNPGGSTVGIETSGFPTQETINNLRKTEAGVGAGGTSRTRSTTSKIAEILNQLDAIPDSSTAIGIGGFLIKSNSRNLEAVSAILDSLNKRFGDPAEVLKQLKQADPDSVQIIEALFPNGIE